MYESRPKGGFRIFLIDNQGRVSVVPRVPQNRHCPGIRFKLASSSKFGKGLYLIQRQRWKIFPCKTILSWNNE